MGDGSSPREAARERVVRCRSHDLPTLISSENLALPPEPTRPHHAGTTPHRRRRPPSSPAVKTKCCAPPPPLRPPPQWNRPPPPPSTRHGRHQRWRDAVPCCAPAPRCITWAGWPREPTPAGQTPVPACDWWRAAIQGATRRRPGLSESQRRLQRRPTTLLGSIRIPPPLLLQDITRPRNCRHPVLLQTSVGCLEGLPATPPALLEPRPSSSQIRRRDISASARELGSI